MGGGAGLAAATDAAEAFLAIEGDGVVDLAADLALGEEGFEGIAATMGDAQGELVPDTFAGEVDGEEDFGIGGCAGTILGDAGKVEEVLAVMAGVAGAVAVVGGKVRELGAEEGGLERIHAEVGAEQLVMVLGLHAMDTEDASALGERVIGGGDEAGVAEAAEVLGREEASGAEIAEGHGGAALPARAHGLGSIFDNAKLGGAGESEDGWHVHALPEEVDGHDGLAARAGLAGDIGEVEVEGVRVDITPNGRGAKTRDGAGGREESEGG